MKKKWIQHFRKTWKKSNVNADNYSDEEILEIAKGIMAPTICNISGITEHWQFEIYWNSMLMLDPDPFIEGGIDLDFFKNRVDENQN